MRTRRPWGSSWSSRSARQGIMLIDCLIYIALLGLILGLAFAAFFRTLEQTTQLERNTADIVRALQAGERWREDVRSTTRPAVFIQGADESTLRLPRSEGHVTYVVRDGAVYREESPSGARAQIVANVKASRFQHEPRKQVACWRWELELQGKQKATRVRPLFSFQALAQAPPADNR